MIIATILSHAIVVGESNDPIIENETHIPVYGRNIIPIKIYGTKLWNKPLIDPAYLFFHYLIAHTIAAVPQV